MSDEIDREVTTKKVTQIPNNSVNGSKISEHRTTRVANDNTSNGLIVGILLALAVGAGAFAYFVNRPASIQPILVPGNDTIRENKSTVIERNNTTTVAPATPQPTPTVEIKIPVTITQPPVAAPTATPKAIFETPQSTPVATPSPTVLSPKATPSPAN